ncbi:MAG TPA: hypothetical protein VKG45_01990 [Actinomycetes bacterium]|nr:hypothetical protein [Actinomycetes bacterium]
MTDPLTLTVVGAAALSEGIKFLYAQAGEVLKRWRERKASTAAGAEPAAAVPVAVELPPAFAGRLQDPRLDFEAVQRLEQDLLELWQAVAGYAQGIQEVDPGDRRLLEVVDALRRALEAVYRQRLTFSGEDRPASGPVAVGEASADEVLGYVAGLRARRVVGGTLTGRVDAGTVGPGGQAVGTDLDAVG